MAINITRGTNISNFIYDSAIKRSQRTGKIKRRLRFDARVYQGYSENRITLSYPETKVIAGRLIAFDFMFCVNLESGAIKAVATEKMTLKRMNPIHTVVRNLEGDALRTSMRELLKFANALGLVDDVIDFLDDLIYVEPEVN